MTRPKTTQSQPIGLLRTDITLTHISASPVWESEKIILFDLYYDDKWIGSRRTFKQVEEEDANISRRNNINSRS